MREDAKPIDMVLYCPNCGQQHIDAPEPGQLISDGPNAGRVRAGWTNPPHRSHKCHGCGCIWRPSDVATNGVADLKTEGKADTWPVHADEVRAHPALTPLDAKAAAADRERLDWLDGLNAALNGHYGTTYGWKLVLSPNIVRLMTGPAGPGRVADIDLHDSEARGATSCREAIDVARAAKNTIPTGDTP